MKAENSFLRYKLHHVLLWLVLGAAWYYLRYQDYSTVQKALLVTAVKTVDLALMVYLANGLLIPKMLYRKNYVVFTLSLLTMIMLSSGCKMYLLGRILNSPALYHWSSQFKVRFYDNVLPHIFLVIAGMAFKLLADYNNMQKRLLQIAREKAETELTFLKAQINPHFLFNALNTVYFLIDKRNTEARAALHKLSDMLRFQLYDTKGERVPVEKELRYLQDYIGLQTLRNGNCMVAFSVDPKTTGFSIEPLLLLPFVENSFKHLSHFNDEEKNIIRIAIEKKDNEMTFTVCNTTEPYKGTANSGGIGLLNVRRRLDLLYPDKHELQLSESEGWFYVNLKLKIESECNQSVVSLLTTNPLPVKG